MAYCIQKTICKGFTLIELMIVVAIIGLLASIAIPAYQTYVARTSFTEVILSTVSLKSSIQVCATNDNSLLNCGVFSANGIPAVPASTVKVASVAWGAPATATSLQIIATATNIDGMGGATYILDASYSNGTVSWAVNAASSCLADALCK